MIMKKALLILIGAFVSVSMFAAGAKEAPPTGPVTIEYWHINSATFGEKAVVNSVNRFQELKPNIKVVHRFQQGSYGGLLQNLQTAMAAGNPPAMAQIGYNNLLFAMHELPHTPIGNFSKEDPQYSAFINGFIPGLADLGKDAKGVQHAVPYALSVPVLYYNADLFKAAGLDPDKPPVTWEELRKAAKQIRDRTGEYGVGLQISTSNNWLPQTLIESNGGRFLDEKGEIGVSRPEVVEAYAFWQQLAVVDKSLPVVTDAEQEQAFLAGRLGMYVKTSASMANFIRQAKFTLRTAVVPGWAGKQKRIAVGGNALFIFGKDAAQQRAAYEFIKFLTSKEGQTIWVLDTGYLPVAAGVADDPNYLKEYFDRNPLTKAALAQLPHSVPWMPFPGPRGQQAEQVLIEAREAILGGAPVQPTLITATERLKALLR